MYASASPVAFFSTRDFSSGESASDSAPVICCATSLWTSKMSVNWRSKVSPHRCFSVLGSTRCTTIRARGPARRTLPSRMAPTPSSSAIAAIFLEVFLYCIEEVREITLSALIFESCAMMSSVMPSLKYSFSGSVLMFSNGSTATDLVEEVISSTMACAAPTAIAVVAEVPKASANCAAVENRSAGSVAIAFLTAASTASGTSSRKVRGEGMGLLNRLAMMAVTVDPRNGGCPTSISKSTQPRL